LLCKYVLTICWARITKSSLFDSNFFSCIEINYKFKREARDCEDTTVVNVNKRDVSEDENTKSKSEINESCNFVNLDRSLLYYVFVD